MLRTLTRTHAVTAGEMRALLAAGVTADQIRDALAVAFCFNVIDRLADTFAFHVPEPAAFKFAAKMLLGKRGYRV